MGDSIAEGILAAVLRRLRKLISLLLAAAILGAGIGVASAVSAQIEHDLGIEQAVPAQPGGESEDRSCSHGCAVHLGGHLLSLAPRLNAQVLPETSAGVPPAWSATAVLGVDPDAFFRPPRPFLA